MSQVASSQGPGMLTKISEELADAVEKVAPSIVRVSARRGPSGTGVVWQADGIIVTADHVLERDEDIMVGLSDGTEVSGTIIGRDPGSDVALLRIEKQGLAPVQQAPAPKVGQLVLALGRSGSGGPAVSLGVISSLQRPTRGWRRGGSGNLITTDAVLYPGFSGGPLIDVSGNVVGMSTSRFGQGTSYAIPMETVTQVAQTLLSQGRIKRGYLGIASQAVAIPSALRQRLQLQQETGLLVVGLEADAPAEKAGLLLGDLLLGLSGEEVLDTEGLLQALTAERVGQAVPLRLIRGGTIQEVSVTIGERS
jgi:S1-C subfamily serine protease